MNVLHIAPSFSSESSAAWRIMRAQQQIGINAKAMVHIRDEKNEAILFKSKYRKESGYKLVRTMNGVAKKLIMQRNFELPWSFDLLKVSLGLDIDDFRVDIINIHWIPSTINLKQLASLHIPVVITLHDVWPLTGGCHCNLSCNNWIIGCKSCPQFKPIVRVIDYPSIQWKAQEKLFRSIPQLGIVSPSSWMASMVELSPKFSMAKKKLIPNCVDPRIFKPRKKRVDILRNVFNDETKIILFVVSGNIHAYHKGFDLFLKVLEKLPYKLPIGILIIGNGAVDRASNIKFPHMYLEANCSQQLMAEIYSSVDLLVSTSRQENLPNVMIEASMSGTPIVSFDVGGISDIIRSNLTGDLIEPTNIDLMAMKIESRLFKPFANNKKISEESIQIFGSGSIAQKYKKFYAELLE